MNTIFRAVAVRTLLAAMFLIPHVVEGSLVTNAPQSIHILTLKPGVDPETFSEEYGLIPIHFYRHAIMGLAASIPDELTKTLWHDSRILAVEPDGETAANEILPFFDPPVVPSGVLRLGLTNFPLTEARGLDHRIGTHVAILDTGIDRGWSEMTWRTEGTYYGFELNVIHTVNFVGDEPYEDDFHGHGTGMASVIGALDNDCGILGVAPGVPLWSVKVMGQNGKGTWSDFIAGVDYIVQHADEIEVANASLGGLESTNVPSSAIRQAVSNAVAHGVVFVTSAGNFRQDVYGLDGVFGTPDDILPAALPEALTVSAMDQHNDTIEPYSDFSASVATNSPVTSPGMAIDVGAPGNNIEMLGPYGDGARNLGTSPAAAHVSGLVALFIAANGRATNAAGVYRIRQALIDTGLPQDQWRTNNTGDPDGHPEPMAFPSLSWIPPVRIAAARRTSQGFQITFPTIPRHTFVSQYTESLTAPVEWVSFATNHGQSKLEVVTALDSATNGSRFYRVVRSATPDFDPSTAGIAPNLLLNGSFEQPASHSDNGRAVFTAGTIIGGGWTVSGQWETSVIENGYPSGLAPLWLPARIGRQKACLSENQRAMTISQQVATNLQAGASYTLSFYQSPFIDSQYDGKVLATVQSASETFSNIFTISRTNQIWTLHTLNFTCGQTAPYTVSLRSFEGFSANVDGVRLVLAP